MTETSTARTLRRVGVWGLSTAGALGLWSSIGAAEQASKWQEQAADAAGAVVGWEAATTEARAPQIVRKVTVIRRHLPPTTTQPAARPRRSGSSGGGGSASGGSGRGSSGSSGSRSSGGTSGGSSAGGSGGGSSGAASAPAAPAPRPAPAPTRASKGS